MRGIPAWGTSWTPSVSSSSTGSRIPTPDTVSGQPRSTMKDENSHLPSRGKVSSNDLHRSFLYQQSQQQKALYDAVKQGNADRLKQLLAEPAIHEVLNTDTYPQLFDLAEKKRKEKIVEMIVDKLLDSDLPAHQADKNESVSAKLMDTAIQKKYTCVADVLLKKGIAVDTVHMVDSDHQTWLMCAAARVGNVEAIEVLLQRGAKVNNAGDLRDTPLHCAADAGHVAVAALLLQKGAAPDSLNEDSYTPLHLAIVEDHLEMASLLLRHGAAPDIVDESGFSPLHSAAENGNLEIVKLLLEKGADPNKHTFIKADTPLSLAVNKKNIEVVRRLLLQPDINPNPALALLGRYQYSDLTPQLEGSNDAKLSALQRRQRQIQLLRRWADFQQTVPDSSGVEPEQQRALLRMQRRNNQWSGLTNMYLGTLLNEQSAKAEAVSRLTTGLEQLLNSNVLVTTICECARLLLATAPKEISFRVGNVNISREEIMNMAEGKGVVEYRRQHVRIDDMSKEGWKTRLHKRELSRYDISRMPLQDLHERSNAGSKLSDSVGSSSNLTESDSEIEVQISEAERAIRLSNLRAQSIVLVNNWKRGLPAMK